MTPVLRARRQEFFENVWDHSQDPFQIQFDERRPLSKEEVVFAVEVQRAVHSLTSDDALGERLFHLVNGSPDRLALLLQLCGLTRNKIVTDLKASVAANKKLPSFPSNYRALASDKRAWLLAGPYLAIRVRRILGPIAGNCTPELLEALNQATWAGYIRQERAKRQGHEGESRLASVLFACSIPFVPIEKADNPLCRDATVNSVSFDIVVPAIERPKVCVKATVHTANIGQYGESKDHLEVDEARRMINSKYAPAKRPLLLALADGIGFASNSAGLNGVLSKCDEFCQFRTLWKGVIVCAARMGVVVKLELPEATIVKHRGFLERFDFLRHVTPKERAVSVKHRLPAGEGTVLLEKLPSSK